MPKKVLLIVLDGIADPDCSVLATAHKPVLDQIARKGVAGLVSNHLERHPDSGTSTWVLFGYALSDYPGRGIFDALGAGITPQPDHVCLRADFATVKPSVKSVELARTIPGPVPKTRPLLPELLIVDRRAGRDTTGLDEFAKLLTGLYIDGVNIDFWHTVGHRGVLILRDNKLLSSAVSDGDPQETGVLVPEIKPLSRRSAAVRTATILNRFCAEAYKLLSNHPINKRRKIPANFILLRGASKLRPIRAFKYLHGLRGAVIAGSPVVNGMGKFLGMDVIKVKGATADTRTNLPGKRKAALAALETHDFVILHILGLDVAAHDKNYELRKDFLERIDLEILRPISEKLDFGKVVLAVASDHCTSGKTGRHIEGEFPFAIFTAGIKPNKVQKFDEASCKAPLGPLIHLRDFVEEVLKFT
jgi:2,3-bisphosphoglycerate-independent phosphoglycerate mutase